MLPERQNGGVWSGTIHHTYWPAVALLLEERYRVVVVVVVCDRLLRALIDDRRNNNSNAGSNSHLRDFESRSFRSFYEQAASSSK